MHKGHYISGAGHLGLIGWALFGGIFNADPLPFEVQQVAVISGAEFEAMLAGDAQPDTSVEIETPQAPVAEEAPETPESVPDNAVERPTPPAPETQALPEPDVSPEPLPTLPPVPEPAIVPDVAPVAQPEETVILLPRTSLRPRPRPANRVAPTPVAQPEQDTKVDDVVREEVKPEDVAETPKPEQEASAPEETATQITPETSEPASGAPSASLRPKTRPQRTTAATEPTTQDSTETESDALKSALQEALAGGDDATPSSPEGPPLTRGEQDALRVSVEQCWVVDVGSQAANVTVTLGMEMDRDGRVVTNSLRLINAKGGDATAVETAFQAARRAVLRCQKTGYDLPAEKYDHWREIEMTFNPESMRLR